MEWQIWLKKLYLSVGADGYFAQPRLAKFENVIRRNSAGENESIESHGYVLWNAGLRWNRTSNGRQWSTSTKNCSDF